MILVEILFELLGEVFVSILLELVLGTTHALDEDKGAKGPAAFVLAATGTVFGALTVLVVQERWLAPPPFPGMSLVLLPLVLGAVMEGWGSLRDGRGRNVSHLGTWYGGAALGLGLAAGRRVALAFWADALAL
jgi:hypothetical protein